MSERFAGSKEHEKLPERRVFDIDEWGPVEYPDTGETSGLGPCLGVILYDPLERKAMVGHFVSILYTSGHKRLLEDAATFFSDRQRLKVWLAGLAPDDGPDPTEALDDAEDIRKTKEVIDAALVRFGIDPVNIVRDYHAEDSPWNRVATMHIDTTTGQYTHELKDV